MPQLSTEKKQSVVNKLVGDDSKHKYYVYALCEKRDNGTMIPFYIGKGEGDRVWQHELEEQAERNDEARYSYVCCKANWDVESYLCRTYERCAHRCHKAGGQQRHEVTETFAVLCQIYRKRPEREY